MIGTADDDAAAEAAAAAVYEDAVPKTSTFPTTAVLLALALGGGAFWLLTRKGGVLGDVERPIVYHYRGQVEVPGKGDYSWQDGYSEDGPGGGVIYPWKTKRQCQKEAAARRSKAVFDNGGDLGGVEDEYYQYDLAREHRIAAGDRRHDFRRRVKRSKKPTRFRSRRFGLGCACRHGR